MDERPVGVVAGDDGPCGETGESVAAAVERVAPATVGGSVATVAEVDPQFVVAVGESAVLELAREGIDCPVLPVDAGPSIPSVPSSDAEDAVETLLGTDDWAAWTETAPVFAVELDGEPVGRGLTDVTVVTSEPARISEYAVECDGDPVTQFRADGVVVTTPIGSAGYATAAGGPRLAPGTGVGAVVPIAPFATRAGSWVLELDSIAVTVCRDEGDVSLLVDDREVALVERDQPVTLDVDGHLAVLCPPGCPGWTGAANWKNSNGNPSE